MADADIRALVIEEFDRVERELPRCRKNKLIPDTEVKTSLIRTFPTMPQNAQTDALAGDGAARLWRDRQDAATRRQRRRGGLQSLRRRVQADARRAQPHRRQRAHRPGIRRGRQHGAAVLSFDPHGDGTGQGTNEPEHSLGKVIEIPVDGRQSETALKVARGTARLLHAHGYCVVSELPLASGRRADLVALGARRRNLDRRDQVLGRRFPRRPEMDGLPDALRPAVLRHHGRGALRDISAGHRADRRRRLRRADRLRGARAPAARRDPQEHDAEASPAPRRCGCSR